MVDRSGIEDSQQPENLDQQPQEQRPDVEGSTIRRQLLRPRTALSFAIAAAILVIFVRRADLDLDEIWSNIRNANLLWLAAAFVVYYFTLFLRAMRWRWMLAGAGVGGAEDDRLPGPAYLTGVYTISWLINCIVPAKLGDAYRAYRVKRDDGIRYSIGFGTIIGERIFDLAVLVILLTGSGLVAFHGSLPGQSGSALLLGLGMVTLVVAGLLVMHFGRNRIESLIPVRFRSHYTNFQISLFRTMRRPLVPAVYAILIWLFEGLRVWLVSESLNAGVGLSMSLFVALLSALLTTLPFTPAGLGVVEVAIVTALTVAGMSKGMSSSVAVLDRVITYWSVILIGVIVALIMTRTSRLASPKSVPVKDGLRSTSS